MTKNELIETVAAKSKGLQLSNVEAVVNIIFGCISDALIRDERVEIRGIGSFKAKRYGARDARNPKTGEKVSVPAKRSPAFTAGKELRDRVDQGSNKNHNLSAGEPETA